MILAMLSWAWMAGAAIVYPLQCSFKSGWLAGELRMSADGKHEFWFSNTKGGYYQCRLRLADAKIKNQELTIMYGGRLACKTDPPDSWEAALSENIVLKIGKDKKMQLFALTGKPAIPCKPIKYDAETVQKIVIKKK